MPRTEANEAVIEEAKKAREEKTKEHRLQVLGVLLRRQEIVDAYSLRVKKELRKVSTMKQEELIAYQYPMAPTVNVGS